MTASPPPSWPQRLLPLLLALLTVALYARVYDYQFVNWDDLDYLITNPYNPQGLTWEGFLWAFNPSLDPYLMPVTRLSFMLDTTLFGLDNPGAFHLVNVALHTVNVLLVYWLFRGWTGSLWRSALLAALFAVHPLHVQGVAWVSERKELLAALFGLASLFLYTRYTRARAAGAANARSLYLLLLVCYLLSLLSKPLWITLPALLLVVDYWPLGRFPLGWRQLLPDKLPLLLLGLGVVYLSTRHLGPNPYLIFPHTPTGWESLATVPFSYAALLWKTLWPHPLALPYTTFQQPLPLVFSLSSLVILLLITRLLLRRWRSHPWAIAGWCWFLGMLSPTVFTLGSTPLTPLSDHWTYVPHIGLFAALLWSLPTPATPRRRRLLGGVALLLVALYGVVSWRQLPVWRNSETFWRNTLRYTDQNHRAHTQLGMALIGEGRTAEALQHFYLAFAMVPEQSLYIVNVAMGLVTLGRDEEARRWSERVLAMKNPLPPDICVSYVVLAISNGWYPWAVRAADLILAREDFNDPLERRTVRMFRLGGQWLAGQREAAAASWASLWHDDPWVAGNRCGVLMDLPWRLPYQGRQLLEMVAALEPQCRSAAEAAGLGAPAAGDEVEAAGAAQLPAGGSATAPAATPPGTSP